ALIRATIVGLMMFQSKMRNIIAERVQKVIVTIVRRAKQGERLLRHVLIVLPQVGRSLKRGRTIGRNVYFRRKFLSWIHRKKFKVLASDDRRIHQSVERNWLELDFISCVRGHLQSGPKLPT